MRLIYFLFCLLISSTLFSQVLPTINSGVLPNDSDPICPITYYSNLDFDTSGYDIGETVNDFTLFDLNGNVFQLSTALALGKPVLLITGSLTCPIFRNELPRINTVFTTYAADVTTIIIYALEAHPTDTSPYSSTVNVTNQNINQGVLFPQPTTYGERKALVDTLMQNLPVVPPVYIDGPCNEWWHNYGPAPQNAYLVDTNGKVIVKHGWFDQFPQDIFCDIDSALGITSGNCNAASTNGSFVFVPAVTDVYGAPGQTMYATGDLINNSTNDVLLAVVKIQENYAAGWDASFCIGICYSTTIDSTTIRLNVGDTMHFSLDFFTSLTPDSGKVRVGFRNVDAPVNQYAQLFRGYTTGVGVMENVNEVSFEVFPNPCSSLLKIVNDNNENETQFFIYDINGKLQKIIVQQNTQTEFLIDVSELAQGFYFIERRGIEISNSTFIKY